MGRAPDPTPGIITVRFPGNAASAVMADGDSIAISLAYVNPGIATDYFDWMVGGVQFSNEIGGTPTDNYSGSRTFGPLSAGYAGPGTYTFTGYAYDPTHAYVAYVSDPIVLTIT